MDKLVKRVTRVERSGQHRDAKVVYHLDDDEAAEHTQNSHFGRLEKAVRHMLKAQVTAAQEAYQKHIEAAEKGGNAWLHEDPRNFMKAQRKAMKEMRKSKPFGMNDEEDEED
jgi:uncharacterized protein with gpF-like domain